MTFGKENAKAWEFWRVMDKAGFLGLGTRNRILSDGKKVVVDWRGECDQKFMFEEGKFGLANDAAEVRDINLKEVDHRSVGTPWTKVAAAKPRLLCAYGNVFLYPLLLAIFALLSLIMLDPRFYRR